MLEVLARAEAGFCESATTTIWQDLDERILLVLRYSHGSCAVRSLVGRQESEPFFGGLRTVGLNAGVVTSRLAMRLPQD